MSFKDDVGNVYVFGGNNGSVMLDDLFKYNALQNQWNQVTDIALPGGRSQGVIWTDFLGNVYLFGGYDGYNWLNDLYQL